MSEWQLIETAPKDGTEFLAWFPIHGGRPYIAHWDKDEYANKPRPHFVSYVWLWGKAALRASQPTHWMPLPDAPKTRTAEKDDCTDTCTHEGAGHGQWHISPEKPV